MVALGCPKNVVDAEVMLGDLNRAGFDVVEEHESADAVVINSCAFVEEAKDESIQAILEAARLRSGGNPDAKIVVTGCMAQRYGEELAAGLPEADLVVGFENYGQLPTALAGAIGGEEMAAAAAAAPVERVQVGSATVPFREEWGRHRLTPRHTAYLRVAEGCDHACTFCAIPGFRGKFRSKPYARVVDEAQRLAAEGVRELNLIAEDTNQYGMDLPGGHRLAELLAELAEIPGIEWIRLLYCYPSYFSDELIEAIATIPQVCKYVDIPLQHADNLVLLSMARPPQQHTEKLLEKLRERVPGLVLRTTFISGFPGESEQAHRNVVEFAERIGFERMGAFAYSEEEGTPAAEMPEQIDGEIRQQRRDELSALAQQMAEAYADSRVGTEIDVLIDSVGAMPLMDGETEEDALADGVGDGVVAVARSMSEAPDIDPVIFVESSADPSVPPLEAGQLRRVRITGRVVTELEAELVA
eukprot:PRCOL_00005367-RA